MGANHQRIPIRVSRERPQGGSLVRKKFRFIGTILAEQNRSVNCFCFYFKFFDLIWGESQNFLEISNRDARWKKNRYLSLKEAFMIFYSEKRQKRGKWLQVYSSMCFPKGEVNEKRGNCSPLSKRAWDSSKGKRKFLIVMELHEALLK